MNAEDVRDIAMALPETTQEPHFDLVSYRIRGKIFATVPPGGEYLHVFVDEERREIGLALYPGIYEKLMWGQRVAGLRVALEQAAAEDVSDLLSHAWRRKAPKRLAEKYS